MKNNFKSIKILLCACSFVFCLFPTLITGSAQASEPFLGQIKMFAGNFAPRGYAFCDGQLLSIASNTALFSILGTTFGGDGRTTFALPDLRGRIPIHEGQGPGLTPRNIGSRGGFENVALSTNQIPMHSHTPTVYGDPVEGDLSDPTGKTWAKTGSGEFDFGGNTDANMAAGAMTVNNAGSDQAHNNIPPYLGIHYIIALVGIYPSR